jgi:lipid-A-disaccharide synthase
MSFEEKKNKLMFVVGEPSGDSHATKLIRELKIINPNIEFFGTTGKKMREIGVETIFNADDFSVVGLPEVLKTVPKFLNVLKILKQTAVERKPDAVILVDFPEFNLKFAKSLKKLGFKVIYYISPQLWAWRKYRVRGIKRDVDLLLTILPFEKNWYSKQGINHVEFVGNPLVGEVKAKLNRQEFCQKHNLDEKKPIITILAGSRRKEVERNLPILFQTILQMSVKNRDLQFVMPIAPTRKLSEFEATKATFTNLPEIIFVETETWEAVASADVAAVKSGTSTLETAILGTPLVIIYKTSTFNWWTLGSLINVEHIGLVNLIAEKRLATELLHTNFTADILEAELWKLLEPNNNQKMREELKKINEKLGTENASLNAAKAIINFLK